MNLINRIMELPNKYQKPEVGKPITVCYWSDRNVYTIESVAPSGRSFVADGLTFTLRKNGTWRIKGESMGGGAGVIIGLADAYKDPSF
jgi:hypothetical protein